MAQEDRTALAHRVLVAVEEGLAKAQRDSEWYRKRKADMAAGLSGRDRMTSDEFYDRMIDERDTVVDAYRKVLGEPWAVSSDEHEDLAAGDHFVRPEDFDEDGPPADINREGEPEFNGAWAR